MLYKLFLEKKKKDALFQKKSKIDFIFTTSMAILLGLFGIFTSHYNSDKFTVKMGVNTAIVTSTVVMDIYASEVNSKAITDTLNDAIVPASINTTPLLMMFHLNSAAISTTTNIKSDTAPIIILQDINSDLFKIDYSIKGTRRSAPTQN